MGDWLGWFGVNTWWGVDNQRFRIRHHKFPTNRIIWGGFRKFRWKVVFRW